MADTILTINRADGTTPGTERITIANKANPKQKMTMDLAAAAIREELSDGVGRGEPAKIIAQAIGAPGRLSKVTLTDKDGKLCAIDIDKLVDLSSLLAFSLTDAANSEIRISGNGLTEFCKNPGKAR